MRIICDSLFPDARTDLTYFFDNSFMMVTYIIFCYINIFPKVLTYLYANISESYFFQQNYAVLKV